MRSIQRLIDESARAWDVSPGLARWCFWTPLLGALLLVPIRFYMDLYRFLLSEDGPIEWLQFGFFLVAFLAAASVTLRLYAEGRTVDATLLLLATLALGFITGEEISWGQRVIGFETPPELREINKQEEFTVHNIGETLTLMNFGMLIVGLWGAGAPLVAERLHLKRLLGRLYLLTVPPFFLAGGFATVFFYRLIRFTVWQRSGFTITKYGEWAELSLAFSICAFLVLNLRRLTRGAESSDRRP